MIAFSRKFIILLSFFLFIVKSPLNFESRPDLSPESGSDRICLGGGQRAPNTVVCITAFTLYFISFRYYLLRFINSAFGYTSVSVKLVAYLLNQLKRDEPSVYAK